MQNLTHFAPAARPTGIVGGSIAADLAGVLIFVTAGRASHHEPLSAAGVLHTAWPFLIGLVGGYVGIALTRWPALSLRGGAVIVVKTLVIGLVLRYGVAGEGTPLPFVTVTVLTLTVLLLGWRMITLAVLRRSRSDLRSIDLRSRGAHHAGRR